MSNIPSSLTPFFQEYCLDDLNIRDSAWTIIQRTLRYGNRVELNWLFSVYPRQEIKDWVQDWGKQALPEPYLTFWQLVLDLPVLISPKPVAPFLITRQ